MPASRPDSLAAAVDAIRAGAIVALPTETVYGLACALSESALERLLAVKGRAAQKGITLLVDSLTQVESVAEVPPPARRLAARFWPGPLTLVLPARPDARLPALLSGGQPTIGVRLPDHPVPRALARELGPLPLTSANRSGEPEARDAAGVLAALARTVDLVLDGGPSAGGVPSSVGAVAGTGDEGASILREGAIAAREIASALD
ncbi:MAG: L-threonylcarbamoyladenylate synthase [Chloroflexota bacterium]|nr:L-threonylcarbamoyladenylate synthase [Chloroflexota bacterium]